MPPFLAILLQGVGADCVLRFCQDWTIIKLICTFYLFAALGKSTPIISNCV